MYGSFVAPAYDIYSASVHINVYNIFYNTGLRYCMYLVHDQKNGPINHKAQNIYEKGLSIF